MTLPRLVIAGTASGVGKTLVSIGLERAYARMGLKIQPYKVGPDYIDPGYHQLACGQRARNLDSWLLSPEAVQELFSHSGSGADLAIIEGVMGLYDGKIRDVSGEGDGASQYELSPPGSAAHVAKLLSCPVILLIDARRLSASAGAYALGFREYDREVNLVGTIITQVGSSRHYQEIKRAVEQGAGLPVLGCIPRDAALHIPERYLGLVPAEEQWQGVAADSGTVTAKSGVVDVFWNRLDEAIETGLELKRILELAKTAPALSAYKPRLFNSNIKPHKVRLGVAKDAAFNFYYEDNLELLAHLGAELVCFSPLQDQALPPGIHGLYLGGGFPEIFIKELSRKQCLHEDIREAARQGMPIYAECGGLIYLSQGLEAADGSFYPLAGIVPGKARLQKKRQALGYVQARAVRDNILASAGEQLTGHRFHWSTLTEFPADTPRAYEVSAHNQEAPRLEGYAKDNVLASYIHLHFGANIKWAERYMDFCAGYERSIFCGRK